MNLEFRVQEEEGGLARLVGMVGCWLVGEGDGECDGDILGALDGDEVISTYSRRV